MKNKYFICGTTNLGIRIEDTIEAENIVEAISIFMDKYQIDKEGSVNHATTFTIIRRKEKDGENEISR